MTALSEPVTKTMVLFFIIPVLCIALGSTTLASDSSGVLLYQKNGVANGDGYGSSVAGCGDVDGDGIADFIVGARATSSYDAGSIFVYSGATGILLFRKDGLGDMQLGFSVSGAGDVNGDGRADFIAGAPFADPAGLTDAGSAFVYSGLDGSLLFEKDGGASGDASGWSVAGVGDIDGDGKSDFIVGSRFAASGGLIDAGSAFVYSGADGSLLYKKSGAAFGDEFGVSVAGIGDVTADGRPDFIIGAWKANPNGAEGAGSVYVYSGLTGSLLYQKNGVGPSDGFGNSTAGAGDVDGDGVADFIVGAPQASPAGLTSAGSAYVYSGSSGALLFQKNGAVAGDRMGFSVAGGGDVNGDSRNDFVISAPNADPNGLDAAGSVFVFSGATGNLIFQKSGTVPYQVFGWRVGGIGDINSDGFADFIIGAPLAPPGLNQPGSAYVYSLACGVAKGDLNGDESLSPADVVLLLGCVFLETGNCGLCFADVSCNGSLNAVDVVVLLNAVFLAAPIDCSP